LKSNAEYNRILKDVVASVTVIPDAGHYASAILARGWARSLNYIATQLPHERPEELSQAMAKAIVSLAENQGKIKAKL
jgi:hypothetical protein